MCLPSGLYNARTGRVLAQAGPEQEITPLPGIYFFDGWRVHPTLVIPANLPITKEAPVCDVEAPAHGTANTEQGAGHPRYRCKKPNLRLQNTLRAV